MHITHRYTLQTQTYTTKLTKNKIREMEFNKWLKRKYPKNYEKILVEFKDFDLKLYFKDFGYRLGVITQNNENKGKLCLCVGNKEYSYEYNNGLCDVTVNSETWLGTFDFRWYVSGEGYNQHQNDYKPCEYLKE